MEHQYDIVIRGGEVVDGSGREPFAADVAINADRIVAVGPVAGSGREEIDARGKIVTPGFTDIHTHYDGQATWEHTMAPSSGHGVSTVVTGNCGVGFAPCRPSDRATLVAILEGVEDIPEVVMTEGLPWNWETFPDYLDALAERRFDVDVATQLPHSPLRVYVMGQRGADREPSTPDDRRRMRELTTQAVRAGALGVTTSRSHLHRRVNGQLSPSVEADLDELIALGLGLKDAGAGVFQLLPDLPAADALDEFAVLEQVARACGRPLSFTLTQSHLAPWRFRDVLQRLKRARGEGLNISAQILPRPVGFLLGLDLSLHPFKLKPSFRAIEHLVLADKVAALRDPQLRARLLAEQRADPNPALLYLSEQIDNLYVLGETPNYFPAPEDSIGAIARRLGLTAEEVAYDALLQNDGHAILYRPATNFPGGSDAGVIEQMRDAGTVLGLGDGGAHYGMVCDASFPSFVLTHWVRDAVAGKSFGLGWAVKALAHDTAAAVGLRDRGLLAANYKADVNVIDLDRLQLHAPQVERNLPGGGRRLTQKATGYAVSMVSGHITYRDGQDTGMLPGRLVRGTAATRAGP